VGGSGDALVESLGGDALGGAREGRHRPERAGGEPPRGGADDHQNDGQNGEVALTEADEIVVELVEVRGDGSSLEDIIAPWLAATARPLAIELEVVNGTVELVDTVHRVAWRLSDVIAAGSLQADGSLAGWTAAGRLRHSDGAAAVGAETVVVGV
jgi:hypothetical protein